MTRCSSIAFFVCVALNNQNEKDCMEKSFCMEKCQITTATSPVQTLAMILNQPGFQQPPSTKISLLVYVKIGIILMEADSVCNRLFFAALLGFTAGLWSYPQGL